jgi:hypothetical protein
VFAGQRHGRIHTIIRREKPRKRQIVGDFRGGGGDHVLVLFDNVFVHELGALEELGAPVRQAPVLGAGLQLLRFAHARARERKGIRENKLKFK